MSTGKIFGVVLILCGFVVYTTGRFTFSSLSELFVLVFPFSIVIKSLGKKGAGLCASRAFVCFVRVRFCRFSLPLGIRG